MDDFDVLWAGIDGETLAGTWTNGSALVPQVDAPSQINATLPLVDLEADFELGEVIGRGGSGVVVAAHQKSLNRPVAIKLLADTAERRAATALLAEARAAGGLEHPNIVPIHALGRDPTGRPVMVMKYLTGITWATLLKVPNHPILDALPANPIDRQLHIVEQVVAAIACAHAAGVVHRDIKPANVMIGAAGEVCVVDWGLARGTGELAPGPAGTPGFMPPEMFSSEARVSERTDVYLLGASLYAALLGRAPHPGVRLAEVLRGTLQAAVEVPAELPAELGALLVKAMAIEPDARFQTVAEFRAALRAFADHRDADRLCAEAEAQLAAITAENVNRATVFGAAQFGFQAALSRWAQSPRAQAGLLAARTAMFHAELALDHLENAAGLLVDFPGPSPQLHAALEARRTAVEAREAEFALLREAQDGGGSKQGRRLIFPVFIVGGVFVPILLGLARIGGHIDEDGFSGDRAVGPLTLGLGLLAALRWSQRPGLRHAFNRRAFSVLGLLLIAVGVNFLLGGIMDIGVPFVVAGNLLLMTFSSA
ncbi:MAG: hypothetical protein ACI9U2_002954, partial [Bradymonadia bacterium]